MGRKEIEAEVLNELSRMEESVLEAKEPDVVEQIEESEENAEAPGENTSQSQDVGKKSDGINKEKKSGVQARIDKLTRSVKEAQERAEKLEAELIAEREAKSVRKEADSDEEIELEPSHANFLSKKIREEAEKILAERDKRAKEEAMKHKQEEMIENFKTTVMKDYGNSFDTETQSFSDDAAEQILSLTELISTNPSFYMPKLEQFGAKRLYKRFIADEDDVVVQKKQMPQTISSQSKPIAKPIDVKLSSKKYLDEINRQILEELEK